MRKILLNLAAAASLVGAAFAGGGAQAQPQGQLIFGVDKASDAALLQPVVWVWAGRNYCWYSGGWHGPGYYWCGYAWRRGAGWGGPAGWRGWRGGGVVVERRGWVGHRHCWRHHHRRWC